MARERTRKNIRNLFDEKERLLKEQPDLRQSYSLFLKDWEGYIKSQELSEKSEKSDNYLVFGASFQE